MKISPSEITKVIQDQLQKTDIEFDYFEAGKVIQIGDGIARAYGLKGVMANELVKFENGVFGLALNLEEDNIGAVLLGPTEE
nr:F0F1 ATP synthase subunit alpha [Mesotoga sp.]